MARKSSKDQEITPVGPYAATSGFADRSQPELTGSPVLAAPGATVAAGAQVSADRERHLLKLGPDGRVLIPSDLRKAMRLRDGDTLVATLGADGELRLWGTDVGLAKLRQLVKPFMPEGSAVDAFLKERRAMWSDEEA